MNLKTLIYVWSPLTIEVTKIDFRLLLRLQLQLRFHAPFHDHEDAMKTKLQVKWFWKKENPVLTLHSLYLSLSLSVSLYLPPSVSLSLSNYLSPPPSLCLSHFPFTSLSVSLFLSIYLSWSKIEIYTWTYTNSHSHKGHSNAHSRTKIQELLLYSTHTLTHSQLHIHPNSHTPILASDL